LIATEQTKSAIPSGMPCRDHFALQYGLPLIAARFMKMAILVKRR
jgi:hypothetical protein